MCLMHSFGSHLPISCSMSSRKGDFMSIEEVVSEESRRDLVGSITFI